MCRWRSSFSGGFPWMVLVWWHGGGCVFIRRFSKWRVWEEVRELGISFEVCETRGVIWTLCWIRWVGFGGVNHEVLAAKCQLNLKVFSLVGF